MSLKVRFFTASVGIDTTSVRDELDGNLSGVYHDCAWKLAADAISLAMQPAPFDRGSGKGHPAGRKRFVSERRESAVKLIDDLAGESPPVQIAQWAR